MEFQIIIAKEMIREFSQARVFSFFFFFCIFFGFWGGGGGWVLGIKRFQNQVGLSQIFKILYIMYNEVYVK
jgi:hypothetical protein